ISSRRRNRVAAVGWPYEPATRGQSVGRSNGRHLERRAAVPRDPAGALVVKRTRQLGARTSGRYRFGVLVGRGPGTNAGGPTRVRGGGARLGAPGRRVHRARTAGRRGARRDGPALAMGRGEHRGTPGSPRAGGGEDRRRRRAGATRGAARGGGSAGDDATRRTALAAPARRAGWHGARNARTTRPGPIRHRAPACRWLGHLALRRPEHRR